MNIEPKRGSCSYRGVLCSPPSSSVDHARQLVLAAVDASPIARHGKGSSPRTSGSQAAVVANVDHAFPLVVLAETRVSLVLHRERGLLDASHLFAPRPAYIV